MSDWIYGIVVVMVFGTVILQVTPEGTYQKYVRLFLGALLMLTVTRPLYSWLDLLEGTRLSFEQEVLSSWMGGTSLGDGQWENGWQAADRWERIMKEQVSQKQETWVEQVLESMAGEYGFLYLDHKVQWDQAGNWPERLTLWVERPETVETDVADDSKDISVVDPINMGSDREFDAKREAEDQAYYEPSELRPLHQALQTIWRLKEDQIVLYWQR